MHHCIVEMMNIPFLEHLILMHPLVFGNQVDWIKAKLSLVCRLMATLSSEFSGFILTYFYVHLIFAMLHLFDLIFHQFDFSLVNPFNAKIGAPSDGNGRVGQLGTYPSFCQ